MKKGFTLIEILISIALLGLMFYGGFAVLQTSLALVSSGKAKTGALSLVTDQLEYIKSLNYNDVAVDGGIPDGDIPPSQTISMNNIDYTVGTFIQYVDDGHDGTGFTGGTPDTNGIVTDYKQVTVTVSWDFKDVTESVEAISTISPPGIESVVGGGTLRVNVIDALGSPVSGANVNIVNDTTSPTVDIDTTTPASGTIDLPGADAASDYEITVTKTGYSTDGTYGADVSNPNPNPSHLTVEESVTTSGTFSIDQTGSLSLQTWEEPTRINFNDPFNNSNKVTNLNQVVLNGGFVELAVDPMTTQYYTSGTFESIPIQPTSDLSEWNQFRIWGNEPSANTDVRVSIYSYDSSGPTTTIIPDSVISGNSTGFSPNETFKKQLRNLLDISTYTALVLKGTLTTTDTTQTPQLDRWRQRYYERPALASVLTDFISVKTIGTDAGSNPIFKNTYSGTTDSAGALSISSVEWDTYLVSPTSPSGWSLSRLCDDDYVDVAPSSTGASEAHFAPTNGSSLRLRVIDDNEDVIEGALVIIDGDTDEEYYTDDCGQTYVDGLSDTIPSNLLDVEISASGYDDLTTEVEISGETSERFELVTS